HRPDYLGEVGRIVHGAPPPLAEDFDRLTRQALADHFSDQAHIPSRQPLSRAKGVSKPKAHDGEPGSFRGKPVMMLGGRLMDTLNIQGYERVRLGDGPIRRTAILMGGG